MSNRSDSGKVKSQKNQKIEMIARRYLGIDTLEVRNMDSLDFHEIYVSRIKEALEEAYNEGMIACTYLCKEWIN